MRKPLGLVAAAFLVSGLASAANRSPHSNPNGLSAPPAHVGGSFGTSSQSVLALTAWDFHPIASDVTYQYVSGGSGTPFGIYRTNASGNVWFEAPVHLPTGALIKQVEVTFCDTAGGDFFSFLAVSDKATGLVTYTDLVLSLSATPGCGSQVATLATPEQIDNDANSYTIEVNLGGTGTPGDNTVEMGQARVGWQLQVSPAPGTPTFGDVDPSNIFYQYIEALAAAGITGGCDLVPNYCPDRPITRAEMAVFKAKALGLHFPN